MPPRKKAVGGTHLVLRFSTTRSTVISSSSTKSPMPTSWPAISLPRRRSLRTAHTRATPDDRDTQAALVNRPRAATACDRSARTDGPARVPPSANFAISRERRTRSSSGRFPPLRRGRSMTERGQGRARRAACSGVRFVKSGSFAVKWKVID